MLDLSSVAIFALTFLLSLFIAHAFGITGRKLTLPGPWGVPLFGILPFLGKSVPNTFQKWRKKYGDIFQIRFGSWDMIVFNGLDTINDAAEFENDAFSDRTHFVLSELLSECNEHADQIVQARFSPRYIQVRKHVSSALREVTNEKSSQFCDLISDEAKRLCDTILKKAEQNSAISIDSDILFSVSSIIYRITYGDDIENNESEVNRRIAITDKGEEFAASGMAMDVMPWLRYLMSWKISTLRDIIMEFVNMDKSVVSQRKVDYHGESGTCIVDYIIRLEERRGDAKDDQHVSLCLYNSLKDIFSAGNGTTATTLSWLILYMIAYPDIQEKVQDEIDQLTDSSRAVNLKDSPDLPYTMATINEILRLTTIVPLALPHSSTRDVNFRGYFIPKGTPVFFNLHSVNHDEKTWGDPEIFRPERLLTSAGQLDKAKCRMIKPFGFGRRKCAGERIATMQIFVFFATLLQRCSFSKPEGDVLNFEPEVGMIYRPHKFFVHVRDRML